MSGVFSDQAFVDRLIERVHGKFVYCPAWRMWFEERDGFWRSADAESRLKDEYRITVETVREGDEINNLSRRRAINSQSQQAALWLLREDSRMRQPPEILALRLKRPQEDSLSMRVGEYSALTDRLTAEEGYFLASLLQTSGGAAVMDWLLFAHAHAKKKPNVLMRTNQPAPELSPLLPIVEKLLGERVVVLPFGYWKSATLTPTAALLLSGAHVVFLDGLEDNYARRHFPREALRLLASRGFCQWEGKDGVWHDLELPSHWVITGPPVKLPGIDIDIRPYCLTIAGEER